MTVSRQDITTDALHWINAELAEIFGSAGSALERFERDPKDADALQGVAASLHSAAGALRMVEVHGAALLAEEMVSVTRALSQRKVPNAQEGLEALSRALLQMPTYLERVAGGGHDVPLILLPLLNDLRAVRGHPLLSESSLFILNADRVGMMPERSADGRRTNIKMLAAQLRATYQSALLNWLRGSNPAERLETLQKIAQKFEDTASTAQVFQVWWVLGGIVEAIIDDGLRPSASIKRLLGQGDRQIKSLAEFGEENEAEKEATEGFLNNLLFYVGRATSAGPKVRAIRSAYGLEKLEADPQATRGEAVRLNAPSVNLMKTVGEAIAQDLAQVKDAIDIFVRTGSGDRSALGDHVRGRTKIADTLGVLGLSELHQEMSKQSDALATFVDGHGDTDDALMPIAAALIGCEATLEEQLVQRIVAAQTGEEQPSLSPSEAAAQSDRQSVIDAVLRECVHNLGRAKEALSQFVDNPSHGAALDPVPGWLRGIEAGLLMLEKRRAMEQVVTVNWHVAQLKAKGLDHLGADELDRLADAIVSVEYFMETVRKGRRDPEYMLDNAATCLESLSAQMPAHGAVVEPEVAAVQPEAELVPTADDEAEELPAVALTGHIENVDDAMVADARVHVDPELLELFIEEAKEEIATLNRHLPRWREQPDNREKLLSIRRSYHTLKGSGRMVGARVLAEFAWPIEQLLNALINHDVEADEALYSVLRDALDALPELVEQLEVGTSPDSDINAIVDRAMKLLGRPLAASEPVAEEDAVPVELPQEPTSDFDDEAAGATITLDPVLHDIFRTEALGHLEAIDAFVRDASASHAPHRFDDALHRAWHTLHGSANMAAVEPVVDIASPINEFLRSVTQEGGQLSSNAVAVIGDASSAIATILQRINTQQPPPDIDELLTAIAKLDPHAHPAVAPSEPESPPPAMAQTQETAQPEPEPETAFDPEVAAIFAEEAEELLAAADPALTTWLLNPSESGAALSELLRHLHTLKGGARMAGVPSMATLSHELESVFENLVADGASLDDAMADNLRLGFDRLHVMQETLAAQAMPPAAEDVLARLRGDEASMPAMDAVELEVLESSHDETPIEEAAPTPSAASEDAEAARLAAEQQEAERAAHEHAQRELAEREQAERDREAREQQAERERLEREAVEQESERVATLEAARRAQAADAAREDVASMASEMAELVEELRDAGEPAQASQDAASEPMSPEEEFAARLAAATANTRPATAVPTPRVAEPAGERPGELARVDARLLDDMLNNAGEVSIFHSRIEQEIGSISFNLTELSQTVVRLRDQLRQLDAETEAQIRYRHQNETDERDDGREFDPLELDRYSTIQQLSRALGESVSDLVSIQDLLSELTRESESLLVQQARVTTELQDSLIRTRMLPFSNFTPRLERVVRGTGRDLGKNVNVTFRGESGELDRQVLQRMMPAFEHLLRNAVAHGIEEPAQRRERGKEEAGTIDVSLSREGTEMAIRIRDDGAGLNVERIKAVASERGLLQGAGQISNDEALNLILTPGFSTASQVTQNAGRGVGMDVVANEIKLLGGSLAVDSKPGIGTEFTARLPLTLAVTQALLIRCGDDQYAIPLPAVEGIVRVPKSDVDSFLSNPSKRYTYGSQNYRFEHLGRYVGTPANAPDGDPQLAVPVVLVRAGEHSTALIADEMIGSREVVVKSVGPLVSGIPGIAGATILGDGSIVMILDVATLVRRAQTVAPVASARQKSDGRPLILVVDDSITVRRVTQRLLERNDMRVMTAKDGVDAVALMAETRPDLVLLDIEMPRMDGYEVSTHIRNSDTLRDLPIIMVTSRTGDKHRTRAFELGVDGYLGKPYQETQLLDAIHPLLAQERAAQQQGQS
ncbi:MAG: Hpt domain-containing protein [Gammaproteobacteria bacterium]